MFGKKWSSPKSLCISAIVAALYAALTLLLAPISYGAVQCRVSEAMTILPIIMPESIPGLFVGCLLANLIGSGSMWDIVFGSMATLIAAVGTYSMRKKPVLAAACPVVANALVVGAVLSGVYGLPFFLTAAQVAIGEVLAVVLGIVLCEVLYQNTAFCKLINCSTDNGLLIGKNKKTIVKYYAIRCGLTMVAGIALFIFLAQLG